MNKAEIAEAIVTAYHAVTSEPLEKHFAMLYMDWLEDIPNFTNERCIIYAGCWCSYSQLLVANFLTRQQEHGKNINSLQEIYWLFHDSFASEILMDERADEFEKRARETLRIVGDMDLSAYGVTEYVKEEEWL